MNLHKDNKAISGFNSKKQFEMKCLSFERRALVHFPHIEKYFYNVKLMAVFETRIYLYSMADLIRDSVTHGQQCSCKYVAVSHTRRQISSRIKSPLGFIRHSTNPLKACGPALALG